MMLTRTIEANVMRNAHEVEQEEFRFIFCLIITYFLLISEPNRNKTTDGNLSSDSEFEVRAVISDKV